MKKVSVLFSLLIAFTLLLSACAQTNNTNDDIEGDETGGAVATQVAGTPVSGENDADNDGVADSAEDDVDVAEGDADDDVAVDFDWETSPYRLSNLLGDTVVDVDDAEIATVDRVIVDNASGQILYAVIEVNGKDVAVPWNALAWNMDDEDPRLVLNADQDFLAEAPSVDVEMLDDTAAEGWDRDITAYWAANPAAGQGGTGAQGGQAAKGTPVVLADVTDVDIRNAAGEDLGDIEDMIYGIKNGQINYVVLATGGVLDVGEKLIPIPFKALRWDRTNDGNFVMVLDVDQEKLINAPGYESWEEFPGITGEGWDVDLTGYWGM